MWFDTWSDVARVLLIGASAYLLLIVVLRLSGKRTLAKLNAFDFVVTVALGSTLATILLNKDVSWSEGAAALVVLAGLQLVVAGITAYVPGARQLVTSKPTLLVRDGDVLDDALRGQRLTRAEIQQAVRSSGQGDLSRIGAVVLESDGTLSVIPAEAMGDRSALADVAGA